MMGLLSVRERAAARNEVSAALELLKREALDNGKTVILEGGRQHHLTHENFKFAKLVPKIMLTDRIVTDVPKYIANVNRNQGLLLKFCKNLYFGILCVGNF